MIQSISTKYKKQSACLLLTIFYLQFLAPLVAAARSRSLVPVSDSYYHTSSNIINHIKSNVKSFSGYPGTDEKKAVVNHSPEKFVNSVPAKKPAMGGPSSPEATSFKAVGSSNLVNLFTGDFSYSIPLLDVGGYPVNLFYNGGITMEQEASWVGLGWNINPGSVSRNMRGIPDDFDGTDSLKQMQMVKPNRTWGGEVGVDGEIIGIKEPNLGLSAGFSYNNYLGPALEVGATLSVSIPMEENIKAEKSASPNIGISLGAKLSSRSGLTLSPSLSAGLPLENEMLNTGVGLSTSYNSRTGISSLNLHSEVSQYYEQDNGTKTTSGTLRLGSNISFAKPSYVPSLRMPMQNSYTSGQVELGLGAFGFRGAATLDGYYSESKVPAEWQTVKKPLVGFMFSEKANNNVNAVMDFNRLNDAEVTPNTPIISAPEYTYDIFSVQGEGTSGSIRAYRGDLGFMRDNETISKDANLSFGADIGIPGHYGLNVNKVSAPTRVGGWEDNNNTLRQTMAFKPALPGGSFENCYFKNPGEATVTSNEVISRIGGDSLVRFKLSGSDASPRIESQLELFGKKSGTANGIRPVVNNTTLTSREKRTQVITMLNADDASKIGLEKSIRNYRTGTALFDATDNHLVYDSLARVGDYRKKNHISEVDVLEQNGMRYVYGLPVYSKTQEDFSFSVGGLPDASTNIVGYDNTDPTLQSSYMDNGSKIDGYLQVQTTPAYASSFLITGLLSPDYVDVTGDGITEDDLGGAVKFNYTESSQLHQWRTPRSLQGSTIAQTAHFNEGKRSETRDNKATISYGQREAWYVNSIESKSMIAIFKTSSRNDAKGVTSDLDGRINSTEDANKKLDEIDLYTKADIKANGIAGAKPVKSVLFYYSYTLCKGTPDNSAGGKLTLDSIMFSYNGQPRSKKEKYAFNYGAKTSQYDNPLYTYNSSDRWGNYKPTSDTLSNPVNPNGLSNIDYPYTSGNKTLDDGFAGAWGLKKILLPSGGQMEVQYEADDYAYVQDRRACNMFNIYGLGTTTSYVTDNGLYNNGGATDNMYVYIKLPSPLQNTDPIKRKTEIYSKYLETLNQLAFKLQIKMPKGIEPLTVYASYVDYDVCANSTNNDIIYIKLGDMDGKSPLAKSAISFIIENLTGQAFAGYDASGVNSLSDFLNLMGSMLTSISSAFTNAENQMRDQGKARNIVLANSFIRLCNPTKIKYGGGSRVKRVLVRDNWDKMTNQYVSTYGQDYQYTTTETVNGQQNTISSGVASYEPGIGSEENPFREILNFSNKLPLASAQYGAIEMPMLEGLYPSPNVGYSKVTIRSIHRNGTHGDSTVRSAIGKQVTEFYTAKDYPSYSSYTPMVSMDYKKDPFFSFFNKEIINRRIVSQGFLVETNDMHGKMKSQSAYSESDENTPLSYSLHTYKNTGKNGLNDKIDYVYNTEGGTVHSGNMGIDMELMTDVREFSIESKGTDIEAQVDLFFLTVLVIPVPSVYPTHSYVENKYRAVTCTKLINYHAIEDSVIVMDKGSVISTKTIAYDAETGTPILTKTANEFNDPIYSASFPAYWAYSGTGPAYQNTGLAFTNVTFDDGRITSGVSDMSVFESGDELYITSPGSPSLTCHTASPDTYKIWAYDKNKNTTALTAPVKDLVFIDASGNPFTKTAVGIRIIRSGKRNNLALTVSSATGMNNPIKTVNGNTKLIVDNSGNILTASAVSYREKWQTDKDVIPKTSLTLVVCDYVEGPDCNGTLIKHINPYLRGLVGNLKPYRSYTYYGSRNETDPAVTTTIRKNGYINGFSNYWGFDVNNNLVPDYTNTKWIWNSELTKVNAHGQELETRDALNRYTAAQYGFDKDLPVAMAQNSRNGEEFAESFEDYSFKETLNNASIITCDSTRYISFNGLVNSGLVDTDTVSVKAHTGKYALVVNGNTQAVKPFLIRPSVVDSFNMPFGSRQTGSLYQVGGNVTAASSTNGFVGQAASGLSAVDFVTQKISFLNGGIDMRSVQPVPTVTNTTGNSATYSYNFSVSTNYYIQVTQAGTYSFNLTIEASGPPLSDNPSMDIGLYKVDDNGNKTFIDQLYNHIVAGGVSTQHQPNEYLCKGVYYLQVGMSDNLMNFTITPAPPQGQSLSSNYTFNLTTTVISQDYSSNLISSNCVSTTPIPASDSMLNPNFALVPGRHMQFSAWVREKCDSVVCYKPTYVKNHIELQFPGSGASNVSVVPSGAIIEGWQKIEGDFTVPANATTANMVLSNDGSSVVYFDDIRIHPFNANMKSYVYDPRTLRLVGELDENNYATFYEYDEEGQLIRVKKETIQGVKTIKETRSAKQRGITEVQ